MQVTDRRRWPVRVLPALCIVAALTGGCAQTVFQLASTTPQRPRDDGMVAGIRYYRPATYMLIRPDYAKGKAEVVVFTGPDTSTLYVARPESWLATNTANLTFDKGVLTQVISKPDSTKFAVDVIGATSAVVTKALEAAAANAKAAASPRSGSLEPATGVFLFKVEGATLRPVTLQW
jgi:hypothetical protein